MGSWSSRARRRRWRMASEPHNDRSTGAAQQPVQAALESPAAASGNGRRGLLIDWGGVLTSNLFASFGAYCEGMGIDMAELSKRFAADPDVRNMLIALEKGVLAEGD